MSSLIARATRSVGTANPTSAERPAGESRAGWTGLGAACKSVLSDQPPPPEPAPAAGMTLTSGYGQRVPTPNRSVA